MGSRQVYALLTALLFTAVCAWMGAAAFEALQSPESIMIPAAEIHRGGELDGIVLRHEECLTKTLDANNGARISAGEGRNESAVYLSRVDGYEYISPKMAENLSPESLDKLLLLPPENSFSAKLIYGFDFYYAAYYYGSIDIEPGQCRVKFEGTENFQRAELLSVSREGDKCAVLLRLMLCPESLDLRFCKAELEY